VPKNRRLPIVVMSALVCCLLVSVAWYEVGVLPVKRQMEAEHERELEAQKQLADTIAAQQAAQEALLKQQQARVTVTVDSQPAATVTIGAERKQTPATFDDIVPGTATVLIQADGYEDYRKDLTAVANQPIDLGTIQLVPKTGDLSISSPQSAVDYTLTGPNGSTHQGQLPATLPGLPAGDYQLTVRQGEWTLPPIPLTIHDGDHLQKDVKFPYGSLSVTSVPPGATVRNGNVVLGVTPLWLSNVHPGPMALSVDLPPYTVQKLSVVIPSGGNMGQQITLQKDRDFIAACGMPMVWIPDGYWVGKYDVTQKVFEKVTAYNPSTFRRPNSPVETVSWEAAMAFCDRLNDEERRVGKLPRGYHYTLPTESQWDSFSADADINLAATSRAATLSSTQEVGASEPNKYGLYDTIGNVWEWCLDDFDDKGNHSMRGGSWLSSSENFPTAETRSAGGPKYADRFTGFRVVLVPEQ
jgi:hypothetical protein